MIHRDASTFNSCRIVQALGSMSRSAIVYGGRKNKGYGNASRSLSTSGRARSARINRHASTLIALGNVNADIANMMISSASKDLMLALVEIVRNIIKGNVNLTNAQYNKFKRCSAHLERLVEPKTTLARRKEILQNGGFFGALASLLAPIVTGITGLFGGR